MFVAIKRYQLQLLYGTNVMWWKLVTIPAILSGSAVCCFLRLVNKLSYEDVLNTNAKVSLVTNIFFVHNLLFVVVLSGMTGHYLIGHHKKLEILIIILMLFEAYFWNVLIIP
jgi:hypothetical protein